MQLLMFGLGLALLAATVVLLRGFRRHMVWGVERRRTVTIGEAPFREAEAHVDVMRRAPWNVKVATTLGAAWGAAVAFVVGVGTPLVGLLMLELRRPLAALGCAAIGVVAVVLGVALIRACFRLAGGEDTSAVDRMSKWVFVFHGLFPVAAVISAGYGAVPILVGMLGLAVAIGLRVLLDGLHERCARFHEAPSM